MNKQNIFTLMLVAIIMFGAGFYVSQNFIQTTPAVTQPETTTPVTPVIETEEKPADTSNSTTNPEITQKWKTFVNNDYGFEFQYPAHWIVSDSDGQIDVTGKNYAVFARITNPDRAGKEDTDMPIERITLSNGSVGCEGMGFGRTGMRAVTGKWELGFGSNYYRKLCFVTDGNISKYWTLNISMSAFDKESQSLMDKSMSTLKFYKHSFVYN